MKFIVVLVLMLSATFGALVTAENIENFLPSDHASVADYISDNLDLFCEKYSEAEDQSATLSNSSDADAEDTLQVKEEPFEATSVEFRATVTLTEGGEATYLDFNQDNGYMLIADGYKLMEFKTRGDLPWAREVDKIYFDKFDGFMIMVDQELVSAKAYFAYVPDEEIDKTTGWYGQEFVNGGWTKIYGAQIYLNDRYGGDYKLASNKSLSGYNSYYTQTMFSGYVGGILGGEMNCVPTAMYNILHYYRNVRGYRSLNGETINFNFLSNDQLAFQFSLLGAKNLGQRPIPKLYHFARSAAIENGYNPTGIAYSKIPSFIKTLSNYIPYSLKASSPLISSMSTIVKNVDNNTPTLLIIGDYLSYNALHAVSAVEYRYYEYTKKVWIFKTVYRKPMIGIDDGQNSPITVQKIRFLDYDGYMNSCGNPVFKAYGITL